MARACLLAMLLAPAGSLLGCATVPTGKESFADLKEAVSSDGGRKEVDCVVEGDLKACQWVAAFWRADVVDSQARCNGGDYVACERVRTYHEGTEVMNRYPRGMQGHLPYDPAALRVDQERLCRLRPHTAACRDAAEYFCTGEGGPVDLAHCKELTLMSCEGDCSALVGVGSRYAKWAQSPEARSAWVAKKEAERRAQVAELDQSSDQLIADEKQFNHEMLMAGLQGAAAGLQAGVATNAAVDESLGQAAQNIQATEAASNRGSKRPATVASSPAPGATGASNPVAPPSQNAAAQNAAAQNAAAQRAAEKKAALNACLATDVNCDYGTSASCAPSTPYGDHWTERRSYQTSETTLRTCASAQVFSRDCAEKVMTGLPDAAQQKEIASRLEDLRRRADALPPKYGCSDQSKLGACLSCVNNWCSYAPSLGDCFNALDEAYRALDAARQLDECVSSGTFQFERDRLKAKHDADCHRQFD